jgi:hypothetical protein
MEAQSCAFGRGPGLWLLQVAVPLDRAVLDVHVLAGEIRVDGGPELGGELTQASVEVFRAQVGVGCQADLIAQGGNPIAPRSVRTVRSSVATTY